MMVIIKMGRKMEKVLISGTTDPNLQEIGWTTKFLDLEYILGLTDENIEDNG